MRDVGTPSSITYSGAEDAMRVFRQCLDTHAREWGVDPARIGSLKARPKLIGDSWMSSGDYPGDALDKNLPGIVVVRLTTNEEGKVTDCAVVQSIATKSMQDVTCQSALKRARFKPAIAADGRASAATFISYINFSVF
jgi:TonB family protein